jgi:hypothetical protein
MAKIPDGLLNELRAAFEREAKKICRDAAHILRVSEADLLKKVKERMSTVKLSVLPEDDDLPRTCQVLLKRGSVFERCRGGCVLGTSKCLRHQTTDQPPLTEFQNTVRTLTRLERCSGTTEPLWCDESTRQVYNRNGEQVGEMNEDNCLELFVLEDDEQEQDQEETNALEEE